MTNLIEIKQNPDLAAQTVGLSKYGRSKMPGCWEMMQAGLGRDNRWVTGLDERASYLRTIKDITEREAKVQEIKQQREDLEALTGFDLDAKFDNPFWQTYMIAIGDKSTIDLNNPIDRIKYHVLLANNYTAPELAVASSPDFANAKYYLSRTEEEQSNKALRQREKDKAVTKLYSLYENKNRLYLVGRYILGTIIKESMSVDELYNFLSGYIKDEKDTRGDHTRKFLSVVDKKIEDLKYKITAIDATDLHVIRFRDGYYQRGQITFGRTLDDVASWFSNPKNSVEFESVLEELKEKRSYS